LCAQLSHISVNRSRRDLTVDFSKVVSRLSFDLLAAWCIFSHELESTPWASTLRRAVARWQKVR
jgi:hypothetical protein